MVDLMVSEQQSGTAGKGVPAGFKLTEVGVIPEDWTIEALSAITEPSRPISYGIVQTGPAVINGIPCIRVVDISNGKIQTGNLITTSGKISESYRRTILQEGDIVIPLRGKVGEIAIVDRNIRGANLTRGVALIALKDEYYPQYVKQYLSSRESADRLLASMNGSALQEITIATLRRFPLAVPRSIKEQIAIACVLSDTDKLINTLEQFITKKQALKTATMQQLLTGKTRLPQFALREDGMVKGYKKSELGNIPEDWYTSTILDIVTHIIDYRGRTPKKLGMDWGNGNIVALSAGNVKKGYIDFLSECYFGSDELYNRWMTSGTPKRNDIVFTMEAPLGNAALIPDDKKYILSQRTILLQINEERFTPIFILQVLLSDFFQSYIYDCATGSTAQGIKRSIFEKLYIAAPKNREEQTAIASILSDMDKDIQTLQQRLDKTRQLKQGMMQELLTGKTRLIERN